MLAIETDVLIVTAITLEYKAVLNVNSGALADSRWEQSRTSNGLPIALRRFVSKGSRPLQVAVTQAGDMGVVGVMNALLPLLPTYSPSCLSMCGVCAGRPGKTRLGDVVAAERLFFHDTGKQLPDRVAQDLRIYQLRDDWKVSLEHFNPQELFANESWWQDRPIPYEWQENWLLCQVYNGVANPATVPDRPKFCSQWFEVLSGLWVAGLLEDGQLAITGNGRSRIERILNLHMNSLPDLSPSSANFPFKLHVAPMGTGNKVIEDEKVWAVVTDYMRKTLGLEMEALVIAAVAQAQRSPRMDAIVMKGVMDFANHGRDDHFKEYAARAAAECLIAFLREEIDTTGIPVSDTPSVDLKEDEAVKKAREFLAAKATENGRKLEEVRLASCQKTKDGWRLVFKYQDSSKVYRDSFSRYFLHYIAKIKLDLLGRLAEFQETKD